MMMKNVRNAAGYKRPHQHYLWTRFIVFWPREAVKCIKQGDLQRNLWMLTVQSVDLDNVEEVVDATKPLSTMNVIAELFNSLRIYYKRCWNGWIVYYMLTNSPCERMSLQSSVFSFSNIAFVNFFFIVLIFSALRYRAETLPKSVVISLYCKVASHDNYITDVHAWESFVPVM